MPEIYRVYDFKNEAAWKKGRLRGIGGSDASAIVGYNPYKTNIDLFEEKTGRRIPEDISGKPYVIYGHAVEPLIRELFKLDHPEYQVEHHEYRILQSVEYPFLQASLDGELTDERGRSGVFEAKSSYVQYPTQRINWKDQIPQNYYIQILHYLLVTGWEFVVLRAHLRYQKGSEMEAVIREYHIERSEVQDDLDYLLAEEIKFWKDVEAGRRPPLILPEI